MKEYLVRVKYTGVYSQRILSEDGDTAAELVSESVREILPNLDAQVEVVDVREETE